MRFSFFFTTLIAALSCVAYWCAYLQPARFGAGFMAMSIPIWLIINAILFIFIWPKKGIKPALPPLFALVAGARFVFSTVAFHPTAHANPNDLNVVSYNVHMFGRHEQNKELTASLRKTVTTELISLQPDVICFQEYLEGLDNTKITKLFREAGLKHSFFSPALEGWVRERGGMVIFSRYPIIKTKAFRRQKLDMNQILYADIVTPTETIRVFNVHLQSNRVRAEYFEQDQDEQEAKRSIYLVYKKLNKGFELRAKQVKQLEAEIAKSPHPVIVCGDFNDLPYSYTYTRTQRTLQNAFEKAGNGLGFSFNGFLPFLRIDQQFASKNLKVTSFQTHRWPYSDHFPIQATYRHEKP
ncbi:Metal-dependent hydrolase, endonuclease/exonuclease/phosphatase family [Flexibacter flexilis DSM 6793]|uniref:Metal-dependent hydrolase, endonuclease/exonuclease/phosphatase family n=1 Tax=Flexibacter flexilis DSM 6793 TaxID=927664 RepID=A0A1I1EFF1_9BACT|nr:endonuclease/exonuclease/phosphatase family protein [Flexibacter flexilis]SFB85302.1 Metal-dependent hydrolase, endonuclease/exonuclease/phosphatase family [Flexibacter flexilis DSM 6793]